MIAQEYEIRVQDALPPSLQEVFVPMAASTEAGGRVTVLTGVIVDQAELTGILEAIDSLGLVLLEVRPTAPAPSIS